MGDVVRREAELRGMKPSLVNMRVLMLKLREEGGKAAVAELCISPIKGAGSGTIVIDGVRSLSEVRRFKEFADIVLLGVFSPRWLRFKRLRKRRRSDAPRALKDLYLRDVTEIEVGLGDVFALADYVLMNDRGMKDLRSSVRRTFTSIR